MNRIDTINARENMFGIGKSGFHDNADLPGQDATYVSPKWFNTVQEELCNLLELRGITLDPASKRQLYDLLTTQVDLEALADEIETNFIRKNQITDNLTTNDANKPVSAKQAKILQDNKLEKDDLKDASTDQKGVVKLNNTLTSTSMSEAATAAQVKVLNDKKLDNNAFGNGVNVTSSRISGATYTNPYDRPLIVVMSIWDTDGANFKLKIGDLVYTSPYDFPQTGMFAFTFVVPPNAEYMVKWAPGSWPLGLNFWWEF